MKKTCSLLLAVILLLGCWAGTCRAAGKDLTILVYLCGSDLESDEGLASGDIREMIASGIASQSAVSVLVATGGTSDWQKFGISSRSVQYYRLGSSKPELLKDAGQQNMGDPDTLSAFLRFGLSAAPARRYMLILWDHGGGPVFGLCNDANFDDDALSLSELRSGLVSGLNGTRLDIIGFDCCLMNCVDLCADLYGIADYSVLSQDLVSGKGLDYDGWMSLLAKDPGLPSETIAVSMAETYVKDNSRGRSASPVTMSVIASDRMPAVAEAAEAFSASLSRLVRTDLAGVVRLRTALVSFGAFMDGDASDLVDVADMCDAFSPLLPAESARLKQAAQQAVYHHCASGGLQDCAHGLSFFLPYETIRSDRKDILDHYSGMDGDYAALAVAMTRQVLDAGYAMSASSYTPSGFFSNSGGSCSGAFCDIWNGYYGDSCSFDDVYDACGTNIWQGLDTASGSIWEGYAASSGIWAGYAGVSPAASPAAGGIWAGFPGAAAATPQAPDAAAALHSIWQGLMQTGPEYYQPGEENQNVLEGVSEPAPAESVLAEASSYFSSAVLTSQMIYSVQLTKEDLDHLAAASGVLSRKEGDELIRLGNLGKTTIDWSTGMIFSMFDGSWPTLEGQMVRAEILYADETGNTRFVIPARINGLRMYLLGSHTADGNTELLGATQGYDENGFAIRGWIPLEAGMTIRPLFTAVSPDGTEREYAGDAVVFTGEGPRIAWDRIPGGEYQYAFGLTDLSGQVHYTDSVPVGF